MKYQRKIVLFVSDIHSGYKFGLCNPETKLSDGISDEKTPVNLGSTQKFLWDIYQKGIEQTKQLAGKDEIVFIFVGDMTHGNKHMGEQMTTRIADQNIISYYNFLPILQLPNVKTARFIVGTAAHSFGEGSSDYLIALMMKEKYIKKDIKALYHGRFTIENTVFDVSHHGPGPGRYLSSKGNAARGYLRDRMMRDIQDGSIPANVYVRGHYHEYIKEFLLIEDKHKFFESFLYVCPPMCMPGDWTRQAISSPPNVNIGLFSVEVINGHCSKEAITLQNFDLRVQEEL